MAIFPVQYSERLPPAVGPNVPINLDTRTGAGVVAGAMGSFGEAMLKIGEDIRKNEMVMEYSNLQLKSDEINIAAYGAARNTQDPLAQKRIEEQAYKDMKALGSKTKAVNDLYLRHLNSVLPQYQIDFAKLNHETRIRNLQADYKINRDKFLEKGDSPENALAFATYIKRFEGTEFLPPALAEAEIADFPVNARLGQARNLIIQGNYDESNNKLNELDKMTLSNEQGQEKIQLQEFIKRAQKQNIVNFEEYLAGKENTLDEKNAPSDEVDSVVKQLTTEIYASNIPATDKQRLHKQLIQWSKGEGEIDYARINALNMELDSAARTGVIDPTLKDRIERARVENAFGPRGKGGEKTSGDMIRRFKRLKLDGRIADVSGIIQQFDREYSDEPELIFLFHKRFNELLLEDTEISDKELFIKVRNLKSTYEDLVPEQFEQMMKQEGTEIPEPPIPVITTKKQYNALPKGAKYQDKNGNIGIKR
jgi:hypothetical protein